MTTPGPMRPLVPERDECHADVRVAGQLQAERHARTPASGSEAHVLQARTAGDALRMRASSEGHESPGEDPGRWLHNMSAPPKSVVTYAGLGALRQTSTLAPAFVFGQPLRCELPPAFRRRSPAQVMALLEPGWSSAQRDAVRELAARIERRAAELPLPDGCAVIPVRPEHPMPWPDALTALALLSKSTGSVWLRAKSPSLVDALQRSSLSLLVPPAFVPGLQEILR